jgi:hypothetical protein
VWLFNDTISFAEGIERGMSEGRVNLNRKHGRRWSHGTSTLA